MHELGYELVLFSGLSSWSGLPDFKVGSPIKREKKSLKNLPDDVPSCEHLLYLRAFGMFEEREMIEMMFVNLH